MRFYLFAIALFAALPAHAVEEAPSRALQMAKRVASFEKAIDNPSPAILISQRVVRNWKTFALYQPTPAKPKQKKRPQP